MKKNHTTRRRKLRLKSILVIEENADQWLIIRAALTQCFPELEPIWINNIAQSITYLQARSQDVEQLPVLILSDLYMPRREDGWTLLEFLQTQYFVRKPPVVVLSSSQANEDIEKSYSFNIASYIIKPNSYHQWLNCFYTFRRYWWEVVALPVRYPQSGV